MFSVCSFVVLFFRWSLVLTVRIMKFSFEASDWLLLLLVYITVCADHKHGYVTSFGIVGHGVLRSHDVCHYC